ncbi:MAG: glycosyltransferase family 4 protein [Myxococcota bacterium]|nr:glycosyltransferase family 4 protein [Myxococcota bacterium]
MLFSGEGAGTADVVLLVRVVPRYRLALYERLWKELGWVVATSARPPASTQLDLVREEAPFLRRFDFRFPDESDPRRCRVPLRRILAELRPRAIVAELGLRMTSSWELALRRTLGGPRVVFWSHGYDMARGLGSAARRLAQTPRWWLSRRVDGHVCYSEEGRAELARHVPAERIFVARNTLDVAPLRRLAREAPPRAREGGPHLLAVARMTSERRFPRLVGVFHRFRERFPGATLTIVGDGPDAGATREAAAGELGRSVRLVGAEYDERTLAAYYAAADLVVFSGAVGLSVNHALAHGVPVLAFARTDTGPGHGPEIAYVIDGVTGRRVPRHCDEALLDALCDFFTCHPEPRRHFAASIARFVDGHLELDAMVADLREVDAFLRRRIAEA